jgi:hypothetical protein
MAIPLVAQDQTQSQRAQVVLTPLFGYRTSINFTTDPGADGSTSKIAFGSSPAYGLALGVRYHDEDVVEARWARQDTRVHVTGPLVIPSMDRVLFDQFHLDCSHEFVVDEWPLWVRPYLMGSIGATHVSGTASTAGFTRFSFGLGAGIQVFPSRQLGFKMQAEWLPIVVSPKVSAFCSAGCIVHFSGDLGSQGEVTFGPVFRF